MNPANVPCPPVTGTVGNFGGAQPDKYTACPPLRFHQSWESPQTLPAEGGVAYVGCSATGLWFYTCLQDSDIFSQATADDQKMWTLGDVVEFFIKPGRARSDYWEIHVTPNSFLMDLYIRDREDFMAGRTSFEEALGHRSQAQFHVAVMADRNQWSTEICIPWQAFGVDGMPESGVVWQFAVCRYNCNGGLEQPELSSVAPFSVRSFHRHEEFLDLVF